MLKVLAGAVVGVLIAAGVAYGTEAPGDLNACVNNVNGNVRLDDACRQNETPTTFARGEGQRREEYAHIHRGALDESRSTPGVRSVMSYPEFVSVDGGTLTVFCFDLDQAPQNVVSVAEFAMRSLPVTAASVAGDDAMAETLCAPPHVDAAVKVSHLTAQPPGLFVQFR